jgi:hypothetical protein
MSHATFARAARAAVGVAVAIAALSIAASAQSKKLGPGPISGMRLTDQGIVFTVGTGSSAVPLSGSVTVSATRGAAEWTRFDRRATVSRSGTQLVQPGTIDGVSIEEYFPDGAQRRLLVRNGDGAATELDVQRVSTGFFVLHANRSPDATTKASQRFAQKQIDALGDGPVTIRLERQTAPPGLDVVVAVTPSPLPEGVDTQSLSLVATTESGGVYYGRSYGFGGGVSFQHLTLPEGAYTLAVSSSVTLGNEITSAGTTLSLPNVLVRPIVVSKESRLFAVAAPAPELPEMVDATVTVDGIDQFDPSFGNRLNFNLVLTSTDRNIQLRAQRDIGDPGPVSVALRLPAGEYEIEAIASHDDGQDNGRGYSTELRLGTHTLPGDVTVSIPPLVRLRGSIRDPELVLASEPDPATGITPYHFVNILEQVGEEYLYGGSATLRGFARGYEVFVPRGAAVWATGSLTVALGRQPDEYRSWENSTGSLQLAVVGNGLQCDADCQADVTVPAIPGFVTLSGTVVDERGRKVPRAFVYASISNVGDTTGTAFRTAVLTDKNGEFRLRLPRGRGYSLSAFPF